jgi:hypothetical protein
VAASNSREVSRPFRRHHLITSLCFAHVYASLQRRFHAPFGERNPTVPIRVQFPAFVDKGVAAYQLEWRLSHSLNYSLDLENGKCKGKDTVMTNDF